ncbi:hypothetical protein SAMN05444275_109165 [Myroides odoratimimus subsp. xuanwuensis]|nr:hypothetical protein SAMN05444275_109165 [Myroides odoratimimus subsp. xuanwuensis]
MLNIYLSIYAFSLVKTYIFVKLVNLVCIDV